MENNTTDTDRISDTVAAVMNYRQGSWQLPRALSEYRYQYIHVAGRSTMHAAAIMARLEVEAHAPAGVDVADLIDAYMRARDDREKAGRRS